MKLVDGKVVIEGDGPDEWGFVAVIDGQDILLYAPDLASPVDMTFFGGTAEQDSGDNGETACGPRTRNEDGTENHIPGFSLPTDPHESSGTAGSPLIGVPCGVEIHVFNPKNNKTVVATKIDNGPRKGTMHAIDATRKSFLDCGGSFAEGLLKVHVRIVDAVKHLPQSAQEGIKALLNGQC